MGRERKFPESLERLLIARVLGEAAAEKAMTAKLSARDLESITSAMLELSDWFNGLSEKPLGDYMRSKWHRAAYLFYFVPANVIKARTVAAELAPTFADREELRILDAGSGPGSLSLGFLDFIARDSGVKRLRVRAIDASAEALDDLHFLLTHYRDILAVEAREVELSIETRVADISRAAAPEGPWDVILFGDTMNELYRSDVEPETQKARLLAEYSTRLGPGGSLAIIEPALKATTRALQAMRDRLTADYGLHICAPCLTGLPCPMLAGDRARDWCHALVPWQRPKIVMRIDELARRRKEAVKFSYCVLRREEGLPAEAPEGETLFRVAGDVLSEKGKDHALLCGKPGCAKFTLLRRDRNENTEVFPTLQRGDIISIDRWEERKDGARLTEESHVRLVRAFE